MIKNIIILVLAVMLIASNSKAAEVNISFEFYEKGFSMVDSATNKSIFVRNDQIINVLKTDNRLSIKLPSKTITITLNPGDKGNQHKLNSLYVRLKYRDGIMI